MLSARPSPSPQVAASGVQSSANATASGSAVVSSISERGAVLGTSTAITAPAPVPATEAGRVDALLSTLVEVAQSLTARTTTVSAGAADNLTDAFHRFKLTAADIPTDVVASNYLPLTGGTIMGDLSITGNVTVSGTQSLSGAITVPYLVASSTTATSTFAGTVGIATSSPFTKLSVGGSTYLGGNLTATGTVQFSSLANGGLASDASGDLYTFSTSTWAFASSTLLMDNNTFGGTSAFGVLSATYASTTQIVSTASAYFATAGGTVGIGTNSPAYKLDVSGDLRVGVAGAIANSLYVDTTTGNVSFGGNISLSKVSPPGAPTATVNPTTGSLNGTYYYAVTYKTATGETVSGIAVTVSPASQQVDLTNIPISSDSRVIGRKLYRTVAGATDGIQAKLVTTINNNTTTTYTDNLPDGSLGAFIPWVNTTGGQIYTGSVRIGVADTNSTVFGYDAMPGNTGYANAAFGVSSLTANTTGLRNSAFGIFSLMDNTTGAANSGFGAHTLGANLTGNNSSAFGFSALWKSTASENTAMGSYASGENVGGTDNVAIGYYALKSNVSGNNNTASGAYAYTNGTGSNNTTLGMSSMYSAGSGSNNTAVGYQSLQRVGSGSGNTAIGVQAGNTNTASGGIFIGFQSGYWETGSNKLIIDNTARADAATARTSAMIYGVFNANPALQTIDFNANVGISTSSPATLLEVGGSTANVTLDGYLNCASFTSNANGLLSCTASDERLEARSNST